MTVLYAPGQGTALVGPAACLLVARPPQDDLVQRLWGLVGADEALPRVARLLLADAAADLPDLVVAAHRDGRVHLLVRGGAALVTTPGGEDEVSATGLATWLEVRLPEDATSLSLCLDASAAPSLPTAGGLLLAGALTLPLPDWSPSAAPAPPPARVAPPRPVPAPAPTAPAAAVAPATALPTREAAGHTRHYVEGAPPAPVVDPLLDAPSAHDGAPAVVASPPAGEPPGGDLHDGGASVDSPPDDVSGGPGNDADDDDGPDYRHLFEASLMARPPVPLVPAVREQPPSPPPSLAPGAPASAVADSLPPAVETPDVRRPAAVEVATEAFALPQLISQVPSPSAGPAAAAPAVPAPAAPPVQAEAVERTISRAEHLAAMRTAVAAPADELGPTVHALLCALGHPNDPQSARCRSCGADLPYQDPVTVPRPVLGRLRLSTGDEVVLDRGVVLGRSPSSDVQGIDRPHLVRIGSSGEVSRRHAEVVLDGWHVRVRDLQSTNGTLVQRPGSEPERVRPEDPILITPGTVVTLADGASFVFEEGS